MDDRVKEIILEIDRWESEVDGFPRSQALNRLYSKMKRLGYEYKDKKWHLITDVQLIKGE